MHLGGEGGGASNRRGTRRHYVEMRSQGGRGIRNGRVLSKWGLGGI